MTPRNSILMPVLGLALLFGGAAEGAAVVKKKKKTKGATPMAMTLTSPSFAHNAKIPSRHTCDGEDLSPAFAWSGAPKGAKSFAIINDDPDASSGAWVHWILWNIPGDTTSLGENLPRSETLPNGAVQGLCWGVDDGDRVGYWGPCPPSGTHRYFFKLYALDTVLKLPARTLKAGLEAAMKGHILSEATLIGLYSRSR